MGDLEYGTDTGGIQPLWTLNIRSANAAFGTSIELQEQLIPLLQQTLLSPWTVDPLIRWKNLLGKFGQVALMIWTLVGGWVGGVSVDW